ncbi:right-handed parallel beta-helix repeat-containing protein [Carboxylicivirga marina]|uniref:right-handed parallel beta-helix repeat-containing protein n=1 Tax=Carboxylicivirga marina TaxID=2800988 RepID=UPI00259963F9|nr:right-handed parallel beta-helix repeat-containing protein [uncultured Carboxylicivirga sp.]
MKYLLTLLLVFTSVSNLFSITVSGNAFLDNSNTHEGIEVIFKPQSPTAEYANAFTIPDGSFSISIQPGIYLIEYVKEGYQGHSTSQELFIAEDMALTDVTLSSQPLINISGNIKGTWYKNTVYNIEGNATISAANTLTIEPGTLVQFEKGCKLSVYGKLISQGTKEENIIFTSTESTKSSGDWIGIFIYGSRTSLITHSILEYAGSDSEAKAIVNVENSGRLEISDCIIRNSERGGIYVQFGGNAKIKNNSISNMPRGMYCNSGSVAEFNANKIMNCSFYGISEMSTSVTIEKNIISQCDVGIISQNNPMISQNILYNNNKGVEPRQGKPTYTNNTFLNNTYAVHLYDSESTEALIENNIFFGNQYAIKKETTRTGDPKSIAFNLFYDNNNKYNGSLLGFGTIISVNNNNDNCDTYYNLFGDPLFLSTDSNNEDFLHLSPTSIAIDAGDSSKQDEDGSIIDIGAIARISQMPTLLGFDNYSENQSIFKCFLVKNEELVVSIEDISSDYIVNVFNISGIQVLSKRANRNNLIKINASGFTSGIYIVTIADNSSNIIYSNKVIKR